MAKKEARQTTINEFETKPVQLNSEAYAILKAIKNQLIKKNKKNFTFSDAVIELRDRTSGTNIQFSSKEVAQIKTQLKGGQK